MQPAGFCVYIHTRNDTGATFYVGKGRNERAHRASNRGAHWSSIAAKHGRTVRIVADGLDEELAFLGEVELIDKLRRLGAPLINRTEGGEGASLSRERRRALSERKKRPESLAKWLPVVRKPILCVGTGRSLGSITEAVHWLRGSGHPKALAANITLCARGHRQLAYGHSWRYITEETSCSS